MLWLGVRHDGHARAGVVASVGRHGALAAIQNATRRFVRRVPAPAAKQLSAHAPVRVPYRSNGVSGVGHPLTASERAGVAVVVVDEVNGSSNTAPAMEEEQIRAQPNNHNKITKQHTPKTRRGEKKQIVKREKGGATSGY